MITAQEAKEISEHVLSAQDEKILKEIDSSIRNAASNGKGSIQLTKHNLSSNYRIQSELKKLGYKYEYEFDQRDGDSWETISWA